MAKTVVIQFNDGTKWFINNTEDFSVCSDENVYQIRTESGRNVYASMNRVRMIGFSEDVYGYEDGV
ncbi:hypothetical protein [Butyricicoccus sp.]|uniref:hypothetical protein n=1 Tax=Butyricicoccus sp. TaxID=2049021 RepID=UPI003F157D95